MQRDTVKSAMFKSIGYDPETQILEVEFNGKGEAGGGVYQYEGFTMDDWTLLRQQESIGKHFAANIRGRFTAKKMEPEDAPQDTHSQKDTDPPKAA
jgi:hypothetical protein